MHAPRVTTEHHMTLDRAPRAFPGGLPDTDSRPGGAARTRPRAPKSSCPVDHVLAVLASTWSIKILWWLSHGPQRFGELRRSLDPISAKVLTGRLRRLEVQGAIERRLLDSVPPQAEYALTALGHEFVPVLKAMGDAAERITGARCTAPPARRTPRRSGVRVAA
jgi:DNA-binding HxlR family transcriptional regulator